MQKRPSSYFHFLTSVAPNNRFDTRTTRKRGSNRNRRYQWAAFVMQIDLVFIEKIYFHYFIRHDSSL